mmetsp:Transcript_34588/g.76006  ORF Transcript_34588/g.76006 Transcript_34588/m.76006 type:complete len:276 (+) Transcript_34588:550-1377(+)
MSGVAPGDDALLGACTSPLAIRTASASSAPSGRDRACDVRAAIAEDFRATAEDSDGASGDFATFAANFRTFSAGLGAFSGGFGAFSGGFGALSGGFGALSEAWFTKLDGGVEVAAAESATTATSDGFPRRGALPSLACFCTKLSSAASIATPMAVRFSSRSCSMLSKSLTFRRVHASILRAACRSLCSAAARRLSSSLALRAASCFSRSPSSIACCRQTCMQLSLSQFVSDAWSRTTPSFDSFETLQPDPSKAAADSPISFRVSASSEARLRETE